MKQYIKLFANCIPVKGYKQSLICDLQRPKQSNFIPNDLYHILINHSNKTVQEIKEHYKNQFDDVIDGYFDFLLKEEFAFCFNEKEEDCFLELENIWKSPSIITNAIIYIDEFREDYLIKIFDELSIFRCDAIQMCFIQNIAIEQLNRIGELLSNSRIISIELMMNCRDESLYDEIIMLQKKYSRFQKVYLGGSGDIALSKSRKIVKVYEKIDFEQGCGKINPYYFSLNMNTFFESQSFNACLNRKICIDTEGNIKNCPNMPQSFGNIKDTTLQEAIEKQGFKDLWYIKKDDIDVCKDCEFRYMCTDCRGFIKDPENIYSQPAKCGYNPYICKWQEQKGYVPVEECGLYSKETGFIPDIEKLQN